LVLLVNQKYPQNPSSLNPQVVNDQSVPGVLSCHRCTTTDTPGLHGCSHPGLPESREPQHSCTPGTRLCVARLCACSFPVRMALLLPPAKYLTYCSCMQVRSLSPLTRPAPCHQTPPPTHTQCVLPCCCLCCHSRIYVSKCGTGFKPPTPTLNPKPLKKLRSMLLDLAGMTREAYVASLCSGLGLRLLAPGALPGAVAWASDNGAIVAHTLRRREAAVLHASLQHYAQHLVRCPGSRLPRFLGLYRISQPWPGGKRVSLHTLQLSMSLAGQIFLPVIFNHSHPLVSITLTRHRLFYLSIYLSIYISIYLSICLSVCLYVCLSC
jgi:hypothetical protein